MATENDLSTEVELLKREVKSMNVIHGRLDTAIEKLTEVSNCINRMLAVHEERLGQQEESQHRAEQEFTSDIKELHSRITTNAKEIMGAATQQHKEHETASKWPRTTYCVSNHRTHFETLNTKRVAVAGWHILKTNHGRIRWPRRE